MNEGLIPRRYAKALIEYAVENGVSEAVYVQMKSLAANFAAEPSLQQVMANPFVDSADKVKLLATAACVKDAEKVFAHFMTLLSDNKRLDMARSIALAYLDIYRKTNNIYLVEVVAASKLSDDDESRLKSLILAHLGGGSMEYNFRIDTSLIGGFVVNIGSERLDASISNELKQLRLKLISN